MLAAAAFAVLPLSAALAQDADGRRPVATRAELQQALQEAEAIVNSGAYSEDFRADKRTEAGLIRERLVEGDFFIGDQIVVQLFGDSGFSGTHQVGPGRILRLPGLPEIEMRGVLRSEIEPFLTEQVGRYLRNPQLRARPLIRLSVLGSVGQPGFYQLDADMLLSDALTQAGGIGNATDFKRSEVLRADLQIVDGEQFDLAIREGRSLDQLNLRAGDVIQVGSRSTKNWFNTLRTIAIVPGLILSVYGLGRLAGVF